MSQRPYLNQKPDDPSRPYVFISYARSEAPEDTHVAEQIEEALVACYSDKFDSAKCDTFESHIRRTTPVGIFDNATPEGAYDLTGNVWSWTLSIFDQDRFPYPYVVGDDREDIHATGVRRPLRGGSWNYVQVGARAVCCSDYNPYLRNLNVGLRLVSVVRPTPLFPFNG